MGTIEGQGLTFTSDEALKEHAEVAYRIGEKRKNKIECEKGFDVTEYDSVMAFDIGYIPMQNNIIIKEIPKDIVPDNDDNKLVPIDLSQEGTKYYIIAVSPRIVDLKKGDIVKIGDPTGGIKYSKPYLKGIAFLEIQYYNVMGVYSKDSGLITDRIRKHEDDLANRRKELGIS